MIGLGASVLAYIVFAFAHSLELLVHELRAAINSIRRSAPARHGAGASSAKHAARGAVRDAGLRRPGLLDGEAHQTGLHRVDRGPHPPDGRARPLRSARGSARGTQRHARKRSRRRAALRSPPDAYGATETQPKPGGVMSGELSFVELGVEMPPAAGVLLVALAGGGFEPGREGFVITSLATAAGIHGGDARPRRPSSSSGRGHRGCDRSGSSNSAAPWIPWTWAGTQNTPPRSGNSGSAGMTRAHPSGCISHRRSAGGRTCHLRAAKTGRNQARVVCHRDGIADFRRSHPVFATVRFATAGCRDPGPVGRS